MRSILLRSIYRARWAVVLAAAALWPVTFVALFGGDSVRLQRMLLAANLSVLLLQAVNIGIAYRLRHKTSLLSVFFLLTVFGLWINYGWSWSCAAKALGFE